MEGTIKISKQREEWSRNLIGGERSFGLLQNSNPQVFHGLGNLTDFVLVGWGWVVHNIK